MSSVVKSLSFLCLSLYLLSFSSFVERRSFNYQKKSDWGIKTPPLFYKKALFYSIIFPGGGHLYTQRFVRSGFLIGLESILILDAFANNLINIKNTRNRYHNLIQSSLTDLTKYTTDTTIQRDVFLNDYFSKQTQARLEKDNIMEIQTLQRSEIGWLIGLHFYGIMDAINIVYQSKNPKPPKTSFKGALYRSLIIPGWGQIYNQEFGKAGMLWMAIGNFLSSAIFRQQVVHYYLDRRREFIHDSTNSTALTNYTNFNSQSTIVNERLVLLRKNRNQYIWGLVLLYLYSIGDSVVDAMLQDFNQPSTYALLPGATPFHFTFVKHF